MRERIEAGSADGWPARPGVRWPSRTAGGSGRARASGPRPVRPPVVPAAGPAGPGRHGGAHVGSAAGRSGGRTVPAGGAAAARPPGGSLRIRLVAAVLIAVVTAAIVVGLGLLADVAAAARAGAPADPGVTQGDVLINR